MYEYLKEGKREKRKKGGRKEEGRKPSGPLSLSERKGREREAKEI